MRRILEPELMDDAEQARAYHEADFSVAHGERIGIFRRLFQGFEPEEVAAQLRAAGLTSLAVAPEGEIHLVVHGRA